MRKKAIVLYKHEEDLSFMLGKVSPLPWLSCHAHRLQRLALPEECHLLIGRVGDLPSLLRLKRLVGGYQEIPLVAFTPESQFPILRMMDSHTCRIVEEGIEPRLLGEAILSLTQEKRTECREDPPCSLTLRERQVVALLLSGEDNKEIASKLGIKLSTVYAHKKNLFLKTGMHSTSQLLVWAMLKEFAP
ncbi:helix-turn-helix transcriptional regulator [Sphaerochaeta sp. PS]|uniref:helix-turn-helix transcriptional regulator n=1 Tax=Sphaerochaeta sp. PS TaxID=3076336 RepID=UPI0028A426DD|nr:helix-turn-helix transcriptional regulator [Sphaerochaeta sp. PS]MDT4763146.1 helix-turn-helix transcriptional regulator [Sphaerochaeta sp. PS]